MTNDSTPYWLLTVSAEKDAMPRNVFWAGLLSRWQQDHPDDVILSTTSISKGDYDSGTIPKSMDGVLTRGSDDYRVIHWFPDFSRLVDKLYLKLKDAVSIPSGITGQIYADHCQDVPLVAFFFETTEKKWYYGWKVNEHLNDDVKETEMLEWVPKLKDQVQKAVETLLSRMIEK